MNEVLTPPVSLDESAAEALSPGPARRTGLMRRLSAATERYAIVLALDVALVAFFAIRLDGFWSSENVFNLLSGTAVLWIVALGMTLVVISGGIDLSVGGQLALSGYFLATVLQSGVPGPLAVVLTLVFSVVCGALINGLLIGRFGLSFFVVTLATMTAFGGVVSLWSGTQTKQVDDGFVLALGTGRVNGVPIALWVMLAVLLVMAYVQRFTYFGRDVYAVGGSVEAARLSGIRTSRTLVAVYAVCALCAGVGAVLNVGQLGAASPQVSSALPLEATAAVLLGGTAFSGGIGGVLGTAAGVLFIGILQNGLGLAGISSFWQQVVTGLILVLAVSLDRMRSGIEAFRNRRIANQGSHDRGAAEKESRS